MAVRKYNLITSDLTQKSSERLHPTTTGCSRSLFLYPEGEASCVLPRK